MIFKILADSREVNIEIYCVQRSLHIEYSLMGIKAENQYKTDSDIQHSLVYQDIPLIYVHCP